MSEQVEFGELLRHYRLAASLSQEALAERSGLSVRAISDLERGARPRSTARSAARPISPTVSGCSVWRCSAGDAMAALRESVDFDRHVDSQGAVVRALPLQAYVVWQRSDTAQAERQQ